jgi:hypothetical protein
MREIRSASITLLSFRRCCTVKKTRLSGRALANQLWLSLNFRGSNRKPDTAGGDGGTAAPSSLGSSTTVGPRSWVTVQRTRSGSENRRSYIPHRKKLVGGSLVAFGSERHSVRRHAVLSKTEPVEGQCDQTVIEQF